MILISLRLFSSSGDASSNLIEILNKWAHRWRAGDGWYRYPEQWFDPHYHHRMEFTLPQLTPENLKMVFEQAYLDVVEVNPIVYEEGDETSIKYWGSIFIKEDGSHWKIQPATDGEFIQFSYNFWIKKEQLEKVKCIKKLKNL